MDPETVPNDTQLILFDDNGVLLVTVSLMQQTRNAAYVAVVALSVRQLHTFLRNILKRSRLQFGAGYFPSLRSLELSRGVDVAPLLLLITWRGLALWHCAHRL